MASSRTNDNNLDEEGWAFVDIHGAVLPKTKNGKKTKKGKNKKVCPQKQDDPDFEVINESGLTMSTILATTEVPPFEKETSEGEDDWGMVKASKTDRKKNARRMKKERRQKQDDADFEVIEDSGLTTSTILATTEVPPFEKETSEGEDNLARSPTQNVHTRANGKPDSSMEDDLEFIQIPDREKLGVDSHSDASSTCSFDVIDENRKKVVLENERDSDSDGAGSDDDADDCEDSGGSNEVSGAEFHFDFPTMVAFFCLTTVLGFVIGHGVGIATSLLVVKTPSLKLPPDVARNTPSTVPSHENIEQNEDSELERKIHKWKSLYRRESQEESDGVKTSEFENSRNLPGLKEAHKQLSLENYKLKKAYVDIQKQLELMKVMSWYRRAQVDKLQQNDPLNMSNVVGMLKKELQYLEAVYFREKRLADMWRNEDKEKTASAANTWKYFKDRWIKKYLGDESPREGVCTDKRECGGEPGTAEDTNSKKSAAQPEISGHEKKGDSGTVDDMPFPDKDGMMDRRDIRTEKESLFWRHLRLAKNDEDVNLEDYNENDGQMGQSSQGIANDHDAAEASDANGNGKSSSEKQPSGTSTNTEENTRGLLAPIDPGWFSYEVFEEDDDTIIAHENKDNVPHVLYAFLDNQFREMVSNPGDIFVMSIKTECFDLNSSFVVSLLNNSPKPIQFFALLPNGKIKQQKIAEQVKVSIVELGLNDGEERETRPLIYEATVTEDGRLNVKEQKNDAESDEHQIEGSKSEAESGDKVEKDDQNKDGFEGKNDEYSDESPQNDEEYGDDELDVSEHNGGNSDVHEGSQNGDQSGDENKVKTNQNSEEGQRNREETSDENQETLSDLEAGEYYMFDQRSAKFYRHTVSTHQYPISEYENLLAEIHKETEDVYYRFPRDMIIEKLIVKDEMTTNPDVHASVGGDDQGQAENTDDKAEPIEYEEDVSNIVQELLRNPWKEGHRNPILMWYDMDAITITSAYVTLFKVQPGELISHDVLKNGKIQTVKDGVKITSYLLHGNELLRIEREDETIRVTMKTSEQEKPDKVDGHSETGNEDYENTVDENFENENSRNSENEDKPKASDDDSPNGNSSQSAPLEDAEESRHEKCTLSLGDRDTTEYWAQTAERGETFIRDTVERVMATPNFKKEDLEKLGVSTIDREESVSYIYCDDGSVQKTWQRIEKVSRSMASEESSQDTESDHDEGSHDERTYDDDDEDDEYSDDEDDEYSDDEEYDDDNYDDEHDIDDEIGEVDDDERDNDGDNDEGQDEDDPEYESDDPDYGVDHDDNEDIDGNSNIGVDDGKTDPEPATGEDSRYPNEKAFEKDLDREKFEMFIAREWQNLKLRQQQFEHSKEQHMRLQQQMMQEWDKMKQQYRELQENLQTNQKPERDVEFEGMWTDLKHQQQQFDSMKKQIEEELRQSLHEEWEKLNKKQVEIESRETHVYYVDDKTVVTSQKVGGFHTLIVDYEEEYDEQQGTDGEPDNDDIPQLQQESEVPNEHDLEPEQGETKTTNEDYDRQTQGDVLNAPQHIQAVEDGDIDRVQSDAWEMHEEENLPHEIPYIAETNENLHVDEVQSEAWQLNQEPSNTYEKHDENPPHELPYNPSTESSKMVSKDVFNIVERQRQEKGIPEELSYTSSRETNSHNDDIVTKENNGRTEDTRDDGQVVSETEDSQSSSQWELQIEKLRESLDKLYEAKKREKNGLQVVTYDIERPEKPTEDFQAESKNSHQTKCPAKCPPGNLECSPKCPKGDAMDDVSSPNFSPLAPNEDEKKSTQESLGKRSDEKTEHTLFPEQSTKMEMDKMKAESSAFMDYIDGVSYLRQLEPEEYGHKMPALKNRPLAPRKKTRKSKKNKAKPTEETGYESKSNKNNRKKRKQDKHWERNVPEYGPDESFHKEKEQHQKFKNNYPLSPKGGKRNARKSTKEKSMRMAQ